MIQEYKNSGMTLLGLLLTLLIMGGLVAISIPPLLERKHLVSQLESRDLVQRYKDSFLEARRTGKAFCKIEGKKYHTKPPSGMTCTELNFSKRFCFKTIPYKSQYQGSCVWEVTPFLRESADPQKEVGFTLTDAEAGLNCGCYAVLLKRHGITVDPENCPPLDDKIRQALREEFIVDRIFQEEL